MLETFFPTPLAFRKWLEKYHEKETEILVGFYKVNSGKASMTWSQSVDEALCFGWIDGVRKNIDDISYSIRFTPRKPKSIWSAVNIKKMNDLLERNLVHPAGLEAFNKRKEEKSRIYAYESETKKLAPGLEKKFKANKKAWQFFSAQAPSYQKTIIHWIMTAKQETTQLSRVTKVINESELQKRLR